MWILYTLVAAFLQTFRNIFSKRLSLNYAAKLTSLCRFLFGLPIAGGTVLLFAFSGYKCDINWISFLLMTTGMAFFQLIANLLLLALFKQKSFAISMTLIKTEAIILAILGIFTLEEFPTIAGWVGITVATGGLIIAAISKGNRQASKRENDGKDMMLGQFFSKSAFYAIAAGGSLATCSIFLKKAMMEVSATNSFYRVTITLTAIMTIQTLISLAMLKKQDFRQIGCLLKKPLEPILIGIFAVLGSFGWFSAFNLQIAAYVRTLGQVEFLFGAMASLLLFKERISPAEIVGMAAVVTGTVLLFF